MPKREPSIHISFSALKSILSNLLEFGGPLELDTKALVNQIFLESKKYSLRHRSLLDSNKKIAQRASKIISSSKEDAFMFSRLYTLIRRQMKHRGVRVITEKDGVQWEYITQAASLSRSFCNDYQLDFEDGTKEYIEIALELINPWSLNKFKMGDERIRNYYEGLMKAEKDPNAKTTQLIYELYDAKVSEKTGISLRYDEQPGEYAHFVDASAICKELNIHPKYFVTAQFEQLDWTNGYPSPSQLASFKAKERAIKWMTENNIRVKKESQKRNKLQEQFMKRYADNAEQ